MYLDLNRSLSHNSFITMLVGARGYGKTYGTKLHVIKNFIKKGEEFIYLRRYQSEIDLVKQGLFGDIIVNKEFDREIEYKENCYLVDEVLAGYAIALSRANHYKSASFPLVSTIIFDEFIIDKTQNGHYLKNEVRKFLDFVETVARMRENVRVIMLANSLSMINPYTIYWDLKFPKGKKVAKALDGLVMLELVGDDEFVAAKKKTRFGMLNAGTDYEKMAVENQFILDTDTFIEHKSGNCRYCFTMVYEGLKLGLWINSTQSVYYLDTDVDPYCALVYSITMEDHTPNKLLLKRTDKGMFGSLIKAFKIGMVRFENQRVKGAMMEVFKLTL